MADASGSRRVLAIGIDPVFADLSAMPGFTPEMVRAYLDSQINRVRDYGYEVDSCLTDLGDTAEAVVEAALRARPYDCIVIGAGLREPPELLLLFEKVLNLVHRLAPGARIAFNSSPTDTPRRRSAGSVEHGSQPKAILTVSARWPELARLAAKGAPRCGAAAIS